MTVPKVVLLTGAAGQIGYALAFAIARGDALGPSTPVILHLLDIPPMLQSLIGLEMELRDCAFPLLHRIVVTADVPTAFKAVQVALLVGSMPRRPGMERKDLLKANCGIFAQQGAALQKYSDPDVKVLVVGNPANTNCLVARLSAPRLPATNFSALTRLDHNRAVSLLADKMGVPAKAVSGVAIWGNHSNTQVPDASRAVVRDLSALGGERRVSAVLPKSWLQGAFVSEVQQRGAAVMNARKLSSAASASKAICDHVRTWLVDGTTTAEGPVSMAVVSDGSYGVRKGLVYSYPVTCSGNGTYAIVQGWQLDGATVKAMQRTELELLEEAQVAAQFLPPGAARL